jgi:hypothetical protein
MEGRPLMRRRKLNKSESLKKNSFKDLGCSMCGKEIEVDNDCIAVQCWECTQLKVPVDPKLLTQRTAEKKPDDVKPRGWRFMKEFVDADGTVYHSGEEMPELKGTLPPTDIASIKAKQKEKGIERKAKKAERAAKKEAKLIKEFEKKKKLKEKEEKRKEKEKKQRLEDMQ